MKSIPRALLTLLSTLLIGVTNPASATVTADGVVSIDAASTPGSILASAGTVDLALNLGAGSGATINSIAFTGATLTVATPVVGAGATLTPDAPTGAGTSLRNLDLSNFLWTTTGDFAGVMNDAVDTNRFPAVAGDALNFTITGLDANRFYFIQLLSGDKRAENENQDYTLGGVTQNAQFGDGGTTDGALVKFTATGETTLTLSVSRVAGNSPPMLAGILIRSVEPGLFAPLSVSGTSDGTPSTLTVQVVNGASTGYNITGASYSGPNAGDFSNGTAFPLSVPAASNADFTVNVTPTAGGTRTATLTLNTSDPSAPTIDVDLSVDVTDPEITIDPSLDFGNTAALPGPTASDIFVDNNGGATDLTVSAPVITGPGAAAFSVTSLPAPITPGGSDSIEVTFNPSAPGYHTAQLQLTTNDPFTPTVTVQLKGEVTGDLISPVTVNAVSSENLFGLNRDANNTINGSGLTGLGSAGSTHSTGEETRVWTSNGNIAAPNDLAPQITYDLGAVHQVTKIREWGYNDPTLNVVLGTQANIIGPDQVEIFTSSDNVNYASAGTVNFALATGTAGYSGNDIPVTLPAARYLRLVIKSNHAGALFDGTGASPGTTDNRGLTGLSEVRFEGTLAPTSPYASWQTANSTAGGAAADHDNDGASNGVELFIGGPNNTTGFTALPGISGNSVTFTKHAGFTPASYGTDFVIETSETLSGSWNPETVGGNVVQSGDSFTYTFPPGGPAKKFVRLVVKITP